MESKKISFGFSKISKKPALLPTKESTKEVTKVELIKCLEGQEIKLVKEKIEEKLLSIPLKDSQKTSTALASLLKRRAVLLGEDEPETKKVSLVESSICPNNGEGDDIEKRAARELLAEVQKNTASDSENNLVLPVTKTDDLPLEGAIEPTLDDYDNIPVQDFGKAMLRGMGWTDPTPNTDKKRGLPTDDTPMVRPKGMGLGAEKSLSKTLLVAPEANEVLEIKRNAYVRILGGKYKGLYGQIEDFDKYALKVIVKLAIGGAKEAFNEFLCLPISKKEYTRYAKCINSTKYDEYKKRENEHGQIKLEKSNEDLVLKNQRKYSSNEKYKDEFKQEKESMRKREENRNKEEETHRNRDKNQVEEARHHGRKYDDRIPRRDNSRDDEKRHRREEDRNGTKFRKDIKQEKYRRDESKSSKYKTVANSSDSECDSYSSNQKWSTKSHSKKSKKSKSKYRSRSSDSETTSCSTESDSEQEQRKKYKKKTKKSKKQRERSRSRGRR